MLFAAIVFTGCASGFAISPPVPAPGLSGAGSADVAAQQVTALADEYVHAFLAQAPESGIMLG
ncbi:MAG TPA: hypothetical protein VGW38_20010, partial [Chloroflexota bacterium]|nr:hypothetical protein [Chloroflexota bacterium]